MFPYMFNVLLTHNNNFVIVNLWERITRWNSFWNGLVPSHLGTRLPISLSACLFYLFLISISKGKKEKNKKYNNY